MHAARRMPAFAVAFAVLATSVFMLTVPTEVRAATEEDQLQETVDGLLRIQPNVGSASENGGAQTVTVGMAGKLVAVELPVGRATFTTTNLVVEIRDGGPGGTLLATSRSLHAGVVPVEPDVEWLRFTFGTPPTLAVGQVIAIVIPFNPPSDSDDPAWYWGKANTDVYAGGVAWGGSISEDSWTPDADGSDLAFTTYMLPGEWSCDVAVAAVDGEWVDDLLTVTVGAEVTFGGSDFPPDEELMLAFTHVDRFTGGYEKFSDADGSFEVTWQFEPGDEGMWEFMALVIADGQCVDDVGVMVTAAATPTPTPAPLPDTAVESPAPSWGDVWLSIGVGLAAAGGVYAAGRRQTGRWPRAM